MVLWGVFGVRVEEGYLNCWFWGVGEGLLSGVFLGGVIEVGVGVE